MPSPSAADLKAGLRRKIRRFKISKQTRLKRSLKACRLILKSPIFKKAKAIGFYAALNDEVDIFFTAHQALQDGKKVFFPRMKGRNIEFCEVKELKSDLLPGKFGVHEPAENTRKRSKSLDLVFVPGRAFDKRGGRLGRGLGYYDRLLAKWPRTFKMGIAFKEQIVPKIPSERHDMKVDKVLSV